MRRRRSYSDLLSPFVVVLERDGVELVRETVLALDEDDARGEAWPLTAKYRIDIFDKTVRTRVERTNAARS